MGNGDDTTSTSMRYVAALPPSHVALILANMVPLVDVALFG